jgi:hypothetical protein
MKNATDSSTIKWTGFVDGAALFKSLDKASLTSCGLSLHSPYDTNGLIVLDGDAEKLLSPLLIDNVSIQCARELSRDFYRTTTDRGAFAETFGISVDSSVFSVLFGYASEYSGPLARCPWSFSRSRLMARSPNLVAAAGLLQYLAWASARLIRGVARRYSPRRRKMTRGKTALPHFPQAGRGEVAAALRQMNLPPSCAESPKTSPRATEALPSEWLL